MTKEAEVMQELADLLKIAGVTSPKIYATYRTGIAVTEENRGSFSPEEIAEWDAVIADYEENRGRGRKDATAAPND